MSRCQRFDFRRISEASLIDQLEAICEDEHLEYDEKVLNYVVREADGSMRDAESILDQVISYSGTHVTEKDAIDVIGVVQREVAYGIVKSVVERDPRAGLGLIAETSSRDTTHTSIQGPRILPARPPHDKGVERKPPFVFMDAEEFAR